ncbi:hypothetical protein D9V37_02305 [Nocardioides mangrovicus]|uniref:Uncharacterized protein n=1 Tax=Nocardioides mangrovicus TaxID=2478913 RepID=A0A3L8P829_9ACTN|nr:hypothetical protein [Nocardioides mangrovicus]RLV50809.1 hypothetical protein D9V37_02305 [Nocardioides mangrovicus]
MSVFLAWSPELDRADRNGPWHEIWEVSSSVWFIDSDDTLSAVYHQLKWSFPETPSPPAIMVAPVAGIPKLRGLPAGTSTWLRERGRATSAPSA